MRMKRFSLLWLCGIGLALASPVREIVTIKLEAARAIAQKALEACDRRGYAVSVAVVDAGGNLKVLLRHDEAGPHTVDSSFKKAYTALTLKRPTLELAGKIARKPEIQALRDMNEQILLLGGGLPIRYRGRIVGAVGVGGAPGGELDEACARAGLEILK